ncbi:MAG TPA: hypothetical protein VNW54_06165 [Granulicella sp.]|jgi:hypothetical protein|nr:hypothetical protein [Granulicella sp.]
MTTQVNIRELGGWDLDAYAWRDRAISRESLEEQVACSKQLVRCRAPFGAGDAALLSAGALQYEEWLRPQRMRAELQEEMKGLDWSLGVVDLRRLIAFQRRLVLDPELPPPPVPQQDDWQALCELAFEGRRSLAHRVWSSKMHGDGLELRLESPNPDLRITVSGQFTGDALPLRLTGGSPFFEVAEYRGRWLLRDGYHRAFQMLRAGVYMAFAVIVRARTMEEVGAVDPWFFREATLFSSRPPMVTDFLNDDLVLTYTRPRLRKMISVRIEESLEALEESSAETLLQQQGGRE